MLVPTSVHGGKTKVWNAIDDRPEFSEMLEVIVRRSDPEARVWRGSDLPFRKNRASKSWDTIGSSSVCGGAEAHLKNDVLLERRPTVPDLPSAWSLSHVLLILIRDNFVG